MADITISKLGPLGDGIYQEKSETIYVDRALPGDKLKVQLRTDSQGLSRGEITEILESSPDRQPAPCLHYDKCGNCMLQHVKESFYRSWKSGVVEEALKKQGVTAKEILPAIFLQGGNRRRLTFSVYRKNNAITIGYYRRRSSVISDIDSCLVADPKLFSLRETLKPILPSFIPLGKPVDIFLQLIGGSVEMIITGPVGKRGEPDAPVLQSLEQLLVLSPIQRIGWRSSTDDPVRVLFEDEAMTINFDGLKVDLPPAAFLQPTLDGEKAIVSTILRFLPPEGKFADLFAGCGTLTGTLLKRGSVDAYEFVSNAVDALKTGARGKPLNVLRRDLYANPLKADELNKYDAIVFDPPRAGCDQQARQMAASSVQTLISVSCNPATFARDSRTLSDGGYSLESLQVIDQFQWSHHVEMVGLFKRIVRVV